MKTRAGGWYKYIVKYHTVPAVIMQGSFNSLKNPKDTTSRTVVRVGGGVWNFYLVGWLLSASCELEFRAMARMVVREWIESRLNLGFEVNDKKE